MSDEDGAVADRYGTRRPPTSRWAKVPERRTFLIDPTGTVCAVYDVTDVHVHPGEVLDDVRRLQQTDGS